MIMSKITIEESRKIARNVLRYLNSGLDPRFVNMNDQIDGHLEKLGMGWELKPNTYIDGIACQFIGQLAKDIRTNAVQKY